jgi:uncharacterized protein involved in outer membrane biogenesis
MVAKETASFFVLVIFIVTGISWAGSNWCKDTVAKKARRALFSTGTINKDLMGSVLSGSGLPLK